MAQEDALAKGTDIAGRRRREALHTDHPVWWGCGRCLWTAEGLSNHGKPKNGVSKTSEQKSL